MKPEDVFDRETEWSAIAAFASAPGSGVRLGIVRGRRRQGKSFLLRRLVRQHRGFYYQALEQEQTPALADFGRALGAFLDVPGGHLPVDSWEAALDVLLRTRQPEGPRLVVIDEFPYLLRHSPELPSLLQRTIDRSADDPAVRLVLCGSALSVMDNLLTGARALRGRASVDLVIRPFDYRTAARFWRVDDPLAALHVDAVLGGTPGYRELLYGQTPAEVGQVGDWLARGVLNPANALFREDEYLLTEERIISDRSLYHSVLTSIASGRSSQTSIAGALGRDQRSVQHALRSLEATGFVTRTDDALRNRRPIYRVAEPIIAFHHAVTRPNLARLEDGQAAEVWRDVQTRFRRLVLGPHFEELARQYARRHWAAPESGGQVLSVAPAVINDRTGRTENEVDLVVHAGGEDDRRRVIALGEAKATSSPVGLSELTRLETIRALVQRHHGTSGVVRLLLFSAYGFTPDLDLAASKRSDVQLLAASDLYG